MRWRMIFDLSYSKFVSINNDIFKEFNAIIYESLDIAIQLIAQIGKEVIMLKRDLKFIFRYILINSLDYWLLIFKWNDKYYINIFLSFGLCMTFRLFNLFMKVLYWIFEFLYKWKVTHYLNDFLFIFPSKTNTNDSFIQYDQVLAILDLFDALEKNMEEYIITHLSFEFDFMRMKVHLPSNKKLHALTATQAHLEAKTMTTIALDETLDFLSHYS